MKSELMNAGQCGRAKTLPWRLTPAWRPPPAALSAKPPASSPPHPARSLSSSPPPFRQRERPALPRRGLPALRAQVHRRTTWCPGARCFQRRSTSGSTASGDVVHRRGDGAPMDRQLYRPGARLGAAAWSGELAGSDVGGGVAASSWCGVRSVAWVDHAV